jgi:hypothetical protein
MIKLFLLSLILISQNIFSKEASYLARSPRALLMGDAFTAIADDEYTLFYNPAALGRNTGVSFTPLSPAFGLTDPLSGIDKFQNFPSTAPAIANKLMDFPIYLQASAYPTVKMAQFGMSLFLNNQTSMVLRNATHPMLDIRYNYDRGFIAGFAYNIGSGSAYSKVGKGIKAKASSGNRLSVGFAVKHINRQGLDGRYDLFGTTLLNTINSGTTTPDGIKTALGYSSGSGWGYDLGVEYSQTNGNSTFSAGYSLLDIGGTRFSRTQGTTDVPMQKMTGNAGVAFKQDFGIFDYTLAADLHPILGPVDFMRQFHLGARVGIPFITAFSGLNEGYLSYGAALDIWPFNVTLGWYGIETGAKFKQQEAKRFILYLSLFDFSIDL